ncbi:MAG TPA: hypothetical protein VE398_11180 [Acidobacteriota bacterium]|nr:hypothetical protein [Acidobacteriota bacterium]
MKQQNKAVAHDREPAEALADALEQRQIAQQAASRWEEILQKTGDKYAKRYFEGQVELSKLRAAHYGVVAKSYLQPIHEQAATSPKVEHEGKTKTAPREPVIRAKASLEVALAERGRNKAVSEREAHQTRAAAYSMLADHCRELGMEGRAHMYEARASLESASARGFEGVIRGYDKKLEDLGVQTMTSKQSPDLEGSLDHLERAERDLENYNKSHAEAMGHLRKEQQIESQMQRLEADATDHASSIQRSHIEEANYQRDLVAALAEKEALAAARSYRSFQDGIQFAHKAYEALSLALAGNLLGTIRTSPDNDGHEKPGFQDVPHGDNGGSQNPAQVLADAKSPADRFSETSESEPQPSPMNSKQQTNPSQQYRSVAVGAVVGQLLRELERGM